MDVHPDLEPIRFLVGSWHGEGRGEYPTIEPFAYHEEIAFVPGPGKPFLAYTQRTRGEDQAPMHSEAGFVRMSAGGPELVIAQPTGLVEVHDGELTDTGTYTPSPTGRSPATTVEFRSTAMGATATAKAVREVVRRIVVAGDTLSYTLDMAYTGVPLTRHLTATLQRV
jgi:hypothetical protein